MLVVLVAMMLGSRDPLALALAYVGPPLVAAFNHKETLEKDGGYYRAVWRMTKWVIVTSHLRFSQK